MDVIQQQVRKSYENTLHILEQELAPYLLTQGGVDAAYDNWYRQLSELRRYCAQILHTYDRPGHMVDDSRPIMIGKHRIDHHIYALLAPMELYRRGFLNKTRTPAEQLAFVSEQFREHGVRFIYAALPTKKATCPEILFPNSLLADHDNIIPQWRHMLYDVLLHGVEVVDLYPCFRRHPEREGLFSYTHNVSYAGAALIGQVLADYVRSTTAAEELEHPSTRFWKERCTATEGGEEYQADRIFYRTPSGDNVYAGSRTQRPGEQTPSKIGIFGNCNLQKYLNTGFDVTAQLSCELSYPVDYLGRLLPFMMSGMNEIANVPDGTFAGKEIVIYLGFPSAAFVRSLRPNCSWSTLEIPESRFYAVGV